MHHLIAGAALLGNWTTYKPVFYRLYYEQDGKRKSLLALSRLGFFAVTAALAYKHEADRAILSIIAPLTLVTVGKQSYTEIEELLKNPQKNCQYIVRGLEETVSLVKPNIIGKGSIRDNDEECKNENIGESKMVDIRYNDGNKKIEIEAFVSKDKCIKKVEIETSPNNEVIIVKKLQCNLQDSAKNDKSLPNTCRYRCKLNYEVLYNEKSIDKSIDIDTHIVIVPITMTQGLKDGTLIIFREKKEKIDTESLIRASVLKGQAMSLVNTLEEYSEQHDTEEISITLFYDTTHGVNALLSPFSYTMNIINQLIVLMLIEKLLRAYILNKNFALNIRAYLYNSDPVILSGRDELKYIRITSKSNISYYYRILIKESTLSTSLENIDGSDAYRRLEGILKSVTGVRSIIDELVSYLPLKNNEKEEDIENYTNFYIQLMYLAKLGLGHWAIATHVLSPRREIRDIIETPIVEYRTLPKERMIEVEYEQNIRSSSLPPHASITSILLGERLTAYMTTLYEALEDEQLDRNKVCFRINTLENMLKDLASKLSYLSSRTSKNEQNVDRKIIVPLIASAIYTEIAEPSARILILNELNKLNSENLEKILDHLLPRGFELSISEKCPPQNEAWVKIFKNNKNSENNKAMCVYPMSPLPPPELTNSNQHVRNFIAHGGLTRLSRDWCLALQIIKEDDEGKVSKCTPYAICIEKPLDRRIMRAITQPP